MWRSYSLRACFTSLLVCLALFQASALGFRKEGSASGAVVLARYTWNVDEKNIPLLGVKDETCLNPRDIGSLAYPIEGARFELTAGLHYDEARRIYELPLVSKDNDAGSEEPSIVFEAGDEVSRYRASGWPLELIDNGSLKTIKTSNGSRYLFIRYPDGKFYCVSIVESSGVRLNFVYLAKGFLLHSISDTSSRTITLNYKESRLISLTQSWMEQSVGRTKTWGVAGLEEADAVEQVKYSHSKNVPSNAITLEYTDEMAASDSVFARTFGSPDAVAAGNGFEPAGLVGSYPFYRGDTIGDDGIVRRGHLSWSIHVYGSADGTKDSALYVPAGFVEHSLKPSPTDAVVTFYYPKLGKLTDVTIVVFHVADFKVMREGERVRIGKIGGPGGSAPYYKHSHIEFYRGNCGLPKLADRIGLRIDPSKVF